YAPSAALLLAEHGGMQPAPHPPLGQTFGELVDRTDATGVDGLLADALELRPDELAHATEDLDLAGDADAQSVRELGALATEPHQSHASGAVDELRFGARLAREGADVSHVGQHALGGLLLIRHELVDRAD